MKYVIDTSILIDFSIFVPESFHPRFWKELENKIISGEIILLDVVVNEIKYRKDLKKWVTNPARKSRMITIDTAVRDRGTQINNIYNIITTSPGGNQKSVADVYIIAYADIHGCGVFSRESGRRLPTDPMKIPDVCQRLSIPYVRKPEVALKNINFPKI